MEILKTLFESGRIVDLILVLVAVEGAALIVARRITARGPSPTQILANLSAGAALLLATRSALAGEAWTLTAAWLGAALLAHAWDLMARWR